MLSKQTKTQDTQPVKHKFWFCVKKVSKHKLFLQLFYFFSLVNRSSSQRNMSSYQHPTCVVRFLCFARRRKGAFPPLLKHSTQTTQTTASLFRRQMVISTLYAQSMEQFGNLMNPGDRYSKQMDTTAFPHDGAWRRLPPQDGASLRSISPPIVKGPSFTFLLSSLSLNTRTTVGLHISTSPGFCWFKVFNSHWNCIARRHSKTLTMRSFLKRSTMKPSKRNRCRKTRDVNPKIIFKKHQNRNVTVPRPIKDQMWRIQSLSLLWWRNEALRPFTRIRFKEDQTCSCRWTKMYRVISNWHGAGSTNDLLCEVLVLKPFQME